MTETAAHQSRPSTPRTALVALEDGNARFVAGEALHPNQDARARADLAAGQAPFAVVFGCSDSRVAAEVIFDQGLGDLFVVRTAGHTMGPEVLGSIEYAISVLQTPLVLVLGHSSCGAVTAARDAADGELSPPGYIAAVVDAVRPSVVEARSQGIESVDEIVNVHVRRTVAELLGKSAMVAEAVQAESCAVVGMSYQLAEGRVTTVTAQP